MGVYSRLAGVGIATGLLAAAALMAGGTGPASAATSASVVTARASGYRYVPLLEEGSSGASVRALQHRLAFLKYYPGPASGYFGSDTLEAVWAFQEVNHLPVTGVVGPATRRALARPRPYRPKYPGQAATRVEVNLGLGVLAFFVRHQVALISHVSSAGHYWFPCGGGECFAETPTGEFHALYFVAGWDSGPLGSLYNPVYFNYHGYAIHGDTYVPAAPVSHGCVRIPMYIAAWFHRDLHVTEDPDHGTEIWIYNQW